MDFLDNAASFAGGRFRFRCSCPHRFRDDVGLDCGSDDTYLAAVIFIMLTIERLFLLGLHAFFIKWVISGIEVGFGVFTFGSLTFITASAIFAATSAPAVAATSIRALITGIMIIVILGLAGLFRLSFQQRLPVRNRDLIVVRMNFTKGKEAVPVPAIFDEGSLERRFYPRNTSKVDVPFKLFLVLRFKIKFFDAVTANDDNPCFLRVGGIYEHFVGHYFLSPRQPGAEATGRLRPALHLSRLACRTIGGSQSAALARSTDRPPREGRGNVRSCP